MDPAHKISPANFMFGSTLGEGSYARVVHVKLKGGDEFAAKIMEKRFIRKEKKSKFVMMEKEVLAKIAHERVVKLYFTFQVIARRVQNTKFLTSSRSWVPKLLSPCHRQGFLASFHGDGVMSWRRAP